MEKLNKQKFLEQRALREKEWASEAKRELCYDCLRAKSACLCEHVKQISTKLKVVILMHGKEAKKEKVGTGRTASLCIPGAEVLIGTDFTTHYRVLELLDDPKYAPCVLYPGKRSKSLGESSFLYENFPKKVPLLFLIDGTWFFAKKIMRMSPNIHSLPWVSFDVNIRSAFHRIKHQPIEQALSTIEAIYYFFREWEKIGLEKFDQQLEVFPHMLEQIINFQLECASDPNRESYRNHGGYGAVSKRTIRKRKGSVVWTGERD